MVISCPSGGIGKYDNKDRSFFEDPHPTTRHAVTNWTVYCHIRDNPFCEDTHLTARGCSWCILGLFKQDYLQSYQGQLFLCRYSTHCRGGNWCILGLANMKIYCHNKDSPFCKDTHPTAGDAVRCILGLVNRNCFTVIPRTALSVKVLTPPQRKQLIYSRSLKHDSLLSYLGQLFLCRDSLPCRRWSWCILGFVNNHILLSYQGQPFLWRYSPHCRDCNLYVF